MDYPSIHFSDENDIVDMRVSGQYSYNQQFRTDLINFIKARIAQIPGAGTVHATETVTESSAV